MGRNTIEEFLILLMVFWNKFCSYPEKGFMKISSIIFTCLLGFLGYSQPANLTENKELKDSILSSSEAKEWQNAMVLFQKINKEFCALKYEQKLNQIHYIACGKPSMKLPSEQFFLKLFRTMRITDERRESAIRKEKELRTKFPQLVTHFEFDEIFHELYAPIQKARETYLNAIY